MAAFDFSALDAKGKQKKGVLEADSARQVRQQLRDKGWTPLSVELTVKKVSAKVEKTGLFSGFSFSTQPSISTGELALVTRQLATLIESGLQIEECLRSVSLQSENPKIKSMMIAVRSKVLEGYTLANAFSEYPKAFPDLFRATVAAGEHAGHLDLVLNSLADYTESRQATQQKVKMAAMYPIILLVVCLSIVVGLLVKVVPTIVKSFASTGAELPGLTTALINVSEFLQNYWLLLVLAGVGGYLIVKWYVSNEKRRYGLHKSMLNVPLIGKISKGFNTARFASTLSILSKSGVPLVEAIKISAEVIPNLYIREIVEGAGVKVSEGSSLYKSLEGVNHFPPMMLAMIASGEASGNLESMLERTANNEDKNLEQLITTVVGLFEPLMLLFMGAVVMIIVLAIMLPIINMNNLV